MSKRGRGNVLKRLGGICDALGYATFCGYLGEHITEEENDKLTELHVKLVALITEMRGEEFAYQSEEPTEQN